MRLADKWQDLLQLALDLEVPIPEIYGTIERKDDGTLYTTRAQRTGCSMYGFGLHMDERPHHFDYLWQDNPKEWEFWMYDIGWGILAWVGKIHGNFLEGCQFPSLCRPEPVAPAPSKAYTIH